MGRPRLIGIDTAEASRVRRALHQWTEADEKAIRPLIMAMQEKYRDLDLQITEPRWETNVYPLYYWAHETVRAKHERVGAKKAYDHVLEMLPTLFSATDIPLSAGEVRAHMTHIMNSEIDILVEDSGYFLFVEAKITSPGQKIKSPTLRQLVRQYIQGRILERLMHEEFSLKKTFALAAIGANHEQTIEIFPNPTERALLRLIGYEGNSLKIPDLAWAHLSASAQAVGTT